MQEIDVNLCKNRLRKELKEFRLNTDKTLKFEIDKAILDNLFSLNGFLQFERYLCYLSEQDEISTEEIVSILLEHKKTVAVPRMRDSQGNMDFHIISCLNDTQEGCFGAREPIENLCPKLVCFSNSVCIVPALAFDKRGYRLGYGKGCYDRFLGEHSLYKIGLCYDDLIYDALPRGKYDIAVDVIVTEKRTIFIEK